MTSRTTILLCVLLLSIEAMGNAERITIDGIEPDAGHLSGKVLKLIS